MTKEPNFREASNRVKVDIGRPYYDPDDTVIQKKLKVIEFRGGFGTYEGGLNYANAFGREAFAHAVADAAESLDQVFGLTKDEGLRIIRESGQLENLKAFNEGLFRFLEGVSDSVRVSVAELVLALNDGLMFAIGVSVAAFHAPAPAMIGRVSGVRIGLGMSIFMASGELARAAGPLIAVWAVATWGLEGL